MSVATVEFRATQRRIGAAPAARPTDPGTVHRPGRLLTSADLAATFVFAFGGGAVAVAAHLDVFAALAFAFLTALGGGIIRDLIICDRPPATLRTPSHPLVAISAGAAAFLLGTGIEHIPALLLAVLDASALGLFAAAGAVKSHARGVNAVVAVVLGMLSATGGGMIRDALLGRVPAALSGEPYALAAAFGAAVTVTSLKLGARRPAALAAGVAACFVLRLASVLLHWYLPLA